VSGAAHLRRLTQACVGRSETANGVKIGFARKKAKTSCRLIKLLEASDWPSHFRPFTVEAGMHFTAGDFLAVAAVVTGILISCAVIVGIAKR